MSVYFLVTVDERLVKVGYSEDVARRVASVGHENSLGKSWRFLGFIDGGRDVEESIHQLFKHHRHEGEWFLYSNWVRDEIAKLSPVTDFPAVKKYACEEHVAWVKFRLNAEFRHGLDVLLAENRMTLQEFGAMAFRDAAEKLRAERKQRGAV
jgi:hypothetical protein